MRRNKPLLPDYELIVFVCLQCVCVERANGPFLFEFARGTMPGWTVGLGHTRVFVSQHIENGSALRNDESQ